MDEKLRQDALDAVTAEDCLELARAVVDTHSPTGYERPCAEFLVSVMQEEGVPAELQVITPERANVIAKLVGTGNGPSLMLNGHIDASASGDPDEDFAVFGRIDPNEQPHSYEIDGGIYGLGANNMKGGVTACFIALRALKRAGVQLPGTVMASGVAGESEKAPVRGATRRYEGPRYQGTGFGTRYLVMHCDPIDYAIVAEPSSLYVVNANAGYLFVKVIVTDTSAINNPQITPGGRPGREQNAIAKAAEVVLALQDWGRTYIEQHKFATGLGTLYPFVSVGAMDGGWPFKPSVTPRACQVYVNLRVTPEQSAPIALAEMRSVLDKLVTKNGNLSYELEVYQSNIPSTITPADAYLCRTAVDVMEQRLGFPTQPFADGEADATNDTNVFRRHGIPAVKCGPATRTEPNARDMTYKHGRHVYRDDIVAAARFYVHMAFELCDKEREANPRS